MRSSVVLCVHGGVMISRNRDKNIVIISFLAIPLILLTMFTIYPVFAMLAYSFTNWNGFSVTKFVGFDNYVKVFSDEQYWSVLRVSLYYLVAGLIQVFLALCLANMLSHKIRGGGIFKGLIFFPFLMNTVAITFIFLMFFEQGGAFDMILDTLGLEHLKRLWIADPKIGNITLSFINLWKFTGYNFVIFLGAIQSVPADPYEAATIDGANNFQKFRFITLPSIKNMIALMTIFSVTGALTVFDIPFIMTRGMNGTGTFLTTIINTAFKFNKYGLASALSVVLLFLVGTITLIQRRCFKEG